MSRVDRVAMVYDSQYTKDACTAAPHMPVPDKNGTAIRVCRRLLRAAADRRLMVSWVKVKGHSGETGNNMADSCAGFAQKGKTLNEQDVEQMLDYIREYG